MTPLPPLSSLRAFEAAARTLSFSAAGREMNVSHAAVAQQVRRLEALLDRSLLRRAGRGLALTSDGAALAAGLTEGFGTIRAAVEALRDEDSRRPVEVTTTPLFALGWLMPRIAPLKAAHPEVELKLNPSGALVDVAGGEADLAIRYGDGDWPGLEVAALLPSRFVVCAAPSVLEGLGTPTPEKILRLPWLQEIGSDEISRWLATLDAPAPPPEAVTHLPGYLLLPALRDGAGVACSTRMFVEDDLAAGRLVSLYESDDAAALGYHLLRRPGPMRPPLRKLWAWLRAEARRDLA